MPSSTILVRGGAKDPLETPKAWIFSFNQKKRKDELPPSPPSGANVGVFNVTAAAILPSWTRLGLKTLLGVTIALYALNQNHMLPKPLAGIVSKALFYPTLPITVSRRLGKWTTTVDDTVIIGGAPFGFAGFPERLYNEHGVRGVINLCDEYKGPVKKYKQLGIDQLRLKTVDHFEPSLRDLKTAVAFIKEHQARGEKVYVHCRAGHGRSAAAAFAWMLYKDPVADARELNAEFCQLRNVRPGLWKQTNIRNFYSWLQSGGVPEKEEEPDLATVLSEYSDKDSGNEL